MKTAMLITVCSQDYLRHFSFHSANESSALQAFLALMRYINLRLTYFLLICLLTRPLSRSVRIVLTRHQKNFKDSHFMANCVRNSSTKIIRSIQSFFLDL